MSTTGPRHALDLPVADLELPEGFVWPAWEAPFDLGAYLQAVPAGTTVKGMFLSSAVETVQAQGGPRLTDERFVAFRDYPLSRVLELSVEGARRVHPDLPLRDGMRRLSRPAFPVFADSLVGRTVFAAVGRDPKAVLRLASRAWKHATNAGKLETEVLDETSVLIRASELYVSWPAAVGIAEGVLQACGRSGAVAHRMRSETEGDFLVRWL